MFLKDLTAHYRQKIENRFPEKLNMSMIQEKVSRQKGLIYLFIKIVGKKNDFFNDFVFQNWGNFVKFVNYPLIKIWPQNPFENMWHI